MQNNPKKMTFVSLFQRAHLFLVNDVMHLKNNLECNILLP